MWERWAVHGACDAHLPSFLAPLWSPLRIIHQSTRETGRFSILDTRQWPGLAWPACQSRAAANGQPANGQRRALPSYPVCHTRFFDNGRDNGRNRARHSRRRLPRVYERGLVGLVGTTLCSPRFCQRSVIRSRIGNLLRIPRPGSTRPPRREESIYAVLRTPYTVDRMDYWPCMLVLVLSGLRGHPSVILSQSSLGCRSSVVGLLGQNTDTFCKVLWPAPAPTAARTASEAFSPVLVIEKS